MKLGQISKRIFLLVAVNILVMTTITLVLGLVSARVLVTAHAAEEHGAGYGRERFEMKRAVVNVEALVEAHLAFQEDAADEGRRLVSMRPQHGCQSDNSRRHALGVFFNLVLKRISGREQRGM